MPLIPSFFDDVNLVTTRSLNTSSCDGTVCQNSCMETYVCNGGTSECEVCMSTYENCGCCEVGSQEGCSTECGVVECCQDNYMCGECTTLIQCSECSSACETNTQYVTPPPTPLIAPILQSDDDITYDSVVVKLTSIPRTDNYLIYYRKSNEDSWNGTIGVTSVSLPKTVDGLSPNTSYLIAYSAINEYGESNLSPTLKITTKIQVPVWSWGVDTSVGANFSNITNVVWIGFEERIDQTRVAKGLPEFGFTQNNPYLNKGSIFYAWIFKQAVDAIFEMNSNISAELLDASVIKSGKDIKSRYFTELRNALNDVINSL